MLFLFCHLEEGLGEERLWEEGKNRQKNRIEFIGVQVNHILEWEQLHRIFEENQLCKHLK